jgi:hypothetical protein
MAFPFEQIGWGLRGLSLSGIVGNISAVGIYFVLCLSPVIVFLIYRKQKKLYVPKAEDGLIFLLCGMLFAVLYLMINPGYIPTLAGMDNGLTLSKTALGAMVYSVLLGYFVLKILRQFSAVNANKFERYMVHMLNLLNVLFVYAAFGACLNHMFDSIASLQAGNYGNEHLLGVTYVFLVLQFIVNALPYVLNVFIVFSALRLLHHLQSDRYSVETVKAAKRMSRLCVVVLVVTVLSHIIFNLLQFVLVHSLNVINVTILFPVFSIIFVLAALLMTRFLEENTQLRAENDQFI